MGQMSLHHLARSCFVGFFLVGLVSLVGLTGCGPQRPPELSAIPETVQKQTPLWPQALSWQAKAVLRSENTDGPQVQMLHLVVTAGSSIRVVLVDEMGTAVDDMLITSKDGQHDPKLDDQLAFQLAPIFRHAFLSSADKGLTVSDGVLSRQNPQDGISQLYAGDPLSLRQIHGNWGWTVVEDYRLLGGTLVPHQLRECGRNYLGFELRRMEDLGRIGVRNE